MHYEDEAGPAADIDGKTRVDRTVLAGALARRHQYALPDFSVRGRPAALGPDALRKSHLLAGDGFCVGRGKRRC